MIIDAPARLAIEANCAAGNTVPDVPTITKQSQSAVALFAKLHAGSGIKSPNITTFGL